MIKPQKTILWSFAALLLGGVLAAVIGVPNAQKLLSPFTAFGLWLRDLSLSGRIGDLTAWSIVLVISALPALGLFWKTRRKADWLLLVASGELFSSLYFLVNPTLLATAVPELGASTLAKPWALVSLGCVLSTLLCWVLLRLLGGLNKKPAHLLPTMLLWVALLYAFLLGFSSVQHTLQTMAAVVAGNTLAARVSTTNLLLILTAVLELIPNLFTVWAILLGGKLASALDDFPFAESTIALAENIAQKCTQMVQLSLLLTVATNALQLLFFSRIAQVHMQIQLPLLTIVTCASLTLLCKYFRRAKAIHDDNATII